MLKNISEVNYKAGAMVMLWLFMMSIWISQLKVLLPINTVSFFFVFFGIVCPTIVIVCFLIKTAIAWKIIVFLSGLTILFWLIVLGFGLVKGSIGLAGFSVFHIAIVSYGMFFLFHRDSKSYYNLKLVRAQPVAGGDATR